MALNPSEGFFRIENTLEFNRVIEMEARLVELDPTRNPNFERILRRLGPKVNKRRMKFEWRNLKKAPVTITLTAIDAAGASQITSATGYTNVHRDFLVYNTRTKELYLANFDAAVAAAAAFAVYSYTSADGTLQTATAVDDVCNLLTEAHAEGEEIPEAFRQVPTQDFDYIMQIDRRGADISDIADQEEEYDPRGQRAIDNKNAMIEYMEGMNRLMYLSQTTRETATADNGERRHAMGGIFQKIVTNKMSLSGVPTGLTPTTIGEILRVTKRPGASAANKLAMAGQNAINAASAWPVGAIQVSPREKQWGYDIKTVITPYGNLDLVYDDTLAQEYGLADKLVVIDENHVRETMLRGLGMQLIQKVVSLSTTHRIVDAITSTFGMQLQNEELFALIEDI
ncbi:hypothetical protein CMI37_29640 [Candidatus Pacearchaeota archaeon]|mgnify:CR=1 FL=1|nr:hypothetical protein [Candidatus Pacearchaeota archaeon]